jgi:hypothetical protein
MTEDFIIATSTILMIYVDTHVWDFYPTVKGLVEAPS